MKLIVNSEEKNIDSNNLTITELLEELSIPSFGLVAELNGEMIPNSELSKTKLNDGAKIDFIRIVGGG